MILAGILHNKSKTKIIHNNTSIYIIYNISIYIRGEEKEREETLRTYFT